MCISNKVFLAARLRVYRETFVWLKIESDSDFHGDVIQIYYLSVLSFFFSFKKQHSFIMPITVSWFWTFLLALVQNVKTQWCCRQTWTGHKKNRCVSSQECTWWTQTCTAITPQLECFDSGELRCIPEAESSRYSETANPSTEDKVSIKLKGSMNSEKSSDDAQLFFLSNLMCIIL